MVDDEMVKFESQCKISESLFDLRALDISRTSGSPLAGFFCREPARLRVNIYEKKKTKIAIGRRVYFHELPKTNYTTLRVGPLVTEGKES